MRDPIASIIMPCFNHEQYLETAVSSILKQSFRNFELFVIDDCSKDQSWELIQALAEKDSRIHPIRHSVNCGASASRNTGLLASRGEYIAFCDADDAWMPGKLETQIGLLKENQTYDVVYCDATIVDENGEYTGKRFSDLYPLPRPPSGELFHHLRRRNFVNMQCVTMRRRCLQTTGLFDRKIKWVEDWLYWMRISRTHLFLYSPIVMANYRVHSLSTNKVQRRGYCLNRCKVFLYLLRNFSNLSSAYKAEAYYRVGVELRRIGKRAASRRFFYRSIEIGSRDLGASPVAIKSAVKLFI